MPKFRNKYKPVTIEAIQLTRDLVDPRVVHLGDTGSATVWTPTGHIRNIRIGDWFWIDGEEIKYWNKEFFAMTFEAVEVAEKPTAAKRLCEYVLHQMDDVERYALSKLIPNEIVEDLFREEGYGS